MSLLGCLVLMLIMTAVCQSVYKRKHNMSIKNFLLGFFAFKTLKGFFGRRSHHDTSGYEASVHDDLPESSDAYRSPYYPDDYDDYDDTNDPLDYGQGYDNPIDEIDEFW